MKTAFLRFCLLIALVFATVASAFGADIGAARAAYDKGNYGLALSLYQECAEQGSLEAQYAVGLLIHDGKGTPADPVLAVKWVQKAAEQGYAEAQLCLGSFYFDGDGVKPDYELSVQWYLRAAKQGNLDAIFNMGFMYENGLGVALDCDKAREWYEKAAAQGDQEAIEVLEYFSCREYANVASLR